MVHVRGSQSPTDTKIEVLAPVFRQVQFCSCVLLGSEPVNGWFLCFSDFQIQLKIKKLKKKVMFPTW